MNRFATLAGALALTVVATGCSVANTTSTEKGLHYNGGIGADQTFEGCVDPSNKQYDRPGANHYIYPVDLRSYDATGREGVSEAYPIEVLSNEGEKMSVPVTISFFLKSDCDSLRDFHDTIGAKYNAFNNAPGNDDGGTSGGWVDLLHYSIGEPLNKQLDLVAKRHDWKALRNDETIRLDLEQTIADEIPGLIADKTGGKQFFERFEVSVQQPEVKNQALLDSIAQQQAAVESGRAEVAKAEAAGAAKVAEANAKEAAAAAAARAANAEVAVAQAEAAKKQAEIAGVGGVEAATKRYMADKGLNADQPTIVYGVPQTGPAQ